MAGEKYDVVVAGGGISGAIAAIAAARLDARTIVIEQHGFLGGMLTASGVGPMMTFHAGDSQVIRGITGELVDRLKAKGLSPGHIVDSVGYTSTVTPFDIEGMKVELEQMLDEADGVALYHTFIPGVKMLETDSGDRRISSLEICNKAGRSYFAGNVFIDATGDADIAAWSGVPCTKGRAADGKTQPMTMKIRLYNIDIEAVKQDIRNRIDKFPRL